MSKLILSLVQMSIPVEVKKYLQIYAVKNDVYQGLTGLIKGLIGEFLRRNGENELAEKLRKK